MDCVEVTAIGPVCNSKLSEQLCSGTNLHSKHAFITRTHN